MTDQQCVRFAFSNRFFFGLQRNTMMPYVVKNYKDKIEKGPLVSKIFFYINDEI